MDSLFEDFLQETMELLPPDEHAMEPGYDRVDMLDVRMFSSRNRLSKSVSSTVISLSPVPEEFVFQPHRRG
jgi:hypothetical protein